MEEIKSNIIEDDNGVYASTIEGDGNELLDEGPFDPNLIDVDISVINLGSLLDQLQYGEIDLEPEFQRSSDVWDPIKKSRLIESVLLGLPLPSFYFSEDLTTKKLTIIDGLQRLCAFKDFWIEKTLHLKGMQFLTSMEGKTFDDLDRSQIRRIQSLKVTLNTLRKSTPVRVKYVIFQRVNTAGEPLTPQEIRNALYQKKATDLVKKMAKTHSFLEATDYKVPTKRMADCDFANRFVAFYLFEEDYDGVLGTFMSKALEAINQMSDIKIESIYQVFNRSMIVCKRLFGINCFRRPDPKEPGKYMRLNKSLFDSLSVNIAKLYDNELNILINRKDEFIEGMNHLYFDEDFILSITKGTEKKPRVDYRFKSINDLIKKIINHD